ncbi:MAG: aspartate carbamoyltransferase regulatory subunit [Clostridia bacterium]|nr:aspartate carbamoyltransferase regulatory subunit [Clostridia bacterium]
MNIDSIKNGIVIDHITAGLGMTIYRLLKLDELDCAVAIIKNATSRKMGKKDIIKIDADIELNMDILGYVDPGITVDIIKNSQLIEKKSIGLPEKLTGVVKCKNPRCITTTEQELPHIFKLTDREKRIYRCIYCEVKAEESKLI